MRHLILTVDVSALDEAQLDALTGALWAQTEADERDGGYPDVDVVSCEVVAV